MGDFWRARVGGRYEEGVCGRVGRGEEVAEDLGAGAWDGAVWALDVDGSYLEYWVKRH